MFRIEVTRQERRTREATSARRGANAIARETLREAKPKLIALVRQRYTYKGAINSKIKVVGRGNLGADLKITGARENITHFKHTKPTRRSYLYAEPLRGSGWQDRRAFMYRTVMHRLGAARYPIAAVKGASVAEMAGHEAEPATPVLKFIESRLSKRLSELNVESLVNARLM